MSNDQGITIWLAWSQSLLSAMLRNCLIFKFFSSSSIFELAHQVSVGWRIQAVL